MKFKKFEDENNGNVVKYVFDGEDFVAESVLYKYGSFYERTVICCSTQSGCPVGCTFCGTGKNFIKNLSANEIVEQVLDVLKDNNILDVSFRAKRFQIMFMSMGEPMLNWNEVEKAIEMLHAGFPNAELLISTIGINDEEIMKRMIKLSVEINKIGLQFSVHKSTDEQRTTLIPFKNKLSLQEIRDFGTAWTLATGRNVYLNYCVDGQNNTPEDIQRLTNIFSPIFFNWTFSVICASEENGNAFNDMDEINEFQAQFAQKGYNTRVFNPDGQDTIGGGCGQLWYTQEWMKKHKKN